MRATRRWAARIAGAAMVSVLLTGTAVTSSACFGKAVVQPVPSASDVQQVRATAIRIADEVRRGTAIIRVLRNHAQALTAPNGPITAAKMDEIDRATIKYGGILKDALTTLDNVTAEPGLKSTAKVLSQALADYLATFPPNSALADWLGILGSTFPLTQQIGGGV